MDKSDYANYSKNKCEMTCSHEELLKYHSGELPPRQMLKVSIQLRDCADTRRLYEELVQLEDAFAELNSFSPPSSIRKTAIKHLENEPNGFFLLRWINLPVPAWSAIAAMAVIAMTVWSLGGQQSPDNQLQSQSLIAASDSSETQQVDDQIKQLQERLERLSASQSIAALKEIERPLGYDAKLSSLQNKLRRFHTDERHKNFLQLPKDNKEKRRVI